MKVLFDTSVLVAAMIESHPAHERALPWPQKSKHKDFRRVYPLLSEQIVAP